MWYCLAMKRNEPNSAKVANSPFDPSMLSRVLALPNLSDNQKRSYRLGFVIQGNLLKRRMFVGGLLVPPLLVLGLVIHKGILVLMTLALVWSALSFWKLLDIFGGDPLRTLAAEEAKLKNEGVAIDRRQFWIEMAKLGGVSEKDLKQFESLPK